MKYKIKELLDVKRGSSPRPILDYLTESGYKWLKISDFSLGQKYVYDTKEFIKESGLSKTRYVKKGTLILTNSGTPGIPVFLGDNMCLHDGFLYFENVKDIVKLDYLFYWFQYYRNQIVNLANGSVFKNLKKEIVENLEIDLPTVAEQEKIIKILNNLDNTILNNNKIIENLQAINNTIFKKWFIDYKYTLNQPMMYESELGLIPKDWKVGILTDLVDFSNGYGFNSKLMLDNEEQNTYKVFKMGNICICGGINKEKTKSWYKKEDCKGLENFVAKKGDILMCMTDMKASENPLLGHTALIDKDDEFVINQRVGILRVKNKKYYPYVYTMTNLPFFINDIRSRANSGVQVNLSTQGICNTKVIIPSSDILDRYCNMAKINYDKMFILMDINEKVTKMKNILLNKLMS